MGTLIRVIFHDYGVALGLSADVADIGVEIVEALVCPLELGAGAVEGVLQVLHREGGREARA
jgi:hypothetical protein